MWYQTTVDAYKAEVKKQIEDQKEERRISTMPDSCNEEFPILIS